jgi:hypothetical protein
MDLLRRFVFIHLEAPGDKLALLVAMLHKLYALVRSGGGGGGVGGLWVATLPVTSSFSGRLSHHGVAHNT